MTRLHRIAQFLLKPITRNGVFFFMMYTLGIVTALIAPSSDRVDFNSDHFLYDNLFLELFLDTYLVCVVLALLPHKVRIWLRRLLYVFIYATTMADVYCYWKFSSTLNPAMLLLVAETDSREAGEFLSSYLTPDVLFSPVGWIVLLIVIHAFIALRHRWCRLFTERQHLLFEAWKDRTRQRWQHVPVTLISGIAVVALLITSAITSWHNKVEMTRMMTAPTIGTIEHKLTAADHAQFYLPIYRLAFSMYSNHLASMQVEKCIAAAKNAKVDSCSYTSPTIVLIIGESYSKAHDAQYDYFLNTTPRQKKLERTGLLTKFTDVVSCWNLTSFVFKNVFSTHVVGEKGEWCDYPLFPELFRKAGYHVTFLTNQFLPRAKEAVYDFSGGFFLNDPTLSEAQFDTRNSQLYRYDAGLLSDYDSKVKDGQITIDRVRPGHETHHNLIIFHLIGQHVSYRQRCPDNQRVFTPDDYKEHRPELGPGRRQMIADYDNAVHYNDSIVTAIVKRFSKRNAIVIYMPDHGEECYEPGRNIVCRNHSAEVDWPLAHYEFEVPFWIYCSRSYARLHPAVFQAIKAARRKPFMTDALPHMLLWLAGISTKDYHAQYNLLSPEYDASRPRILKNKADYDKLRPKEK